MKYDISLCGPPPPLREILDPPLAMTFFKLTTIDLTDLDVWEQWEQPVSFTPN